MIYKCLLGQGIENTDNTVDALYIYILRVNKISISFQYTPAVLNFVASLYDHSSIILYVSRKIKNALILKGKSILLNSCKSSLCV